MLAIMRASRTVDNLLAVRIPLSSMHLKDPETLTSRGCRTSESCEGRKTRTIPLSLYKIRTQYKM